MGGRLLAPTPPPRVTGEEAILSLLDERAAGATICPSEAARRLAGSVAGPAGNWREQMDTIHAATDALSTRGAIVLSWKGIAMQKRRGPYRIARR